MNSTKFFKICMLLVFVNSLTINSLQAAFTPPVPPANAPTSGNSLKVTNKSTSNVKVYVASRNSDDTNSVYTASGVTTPVSGTIATIRANTSVVPVVPSTLTAPSVSVSYPKTARAVFVDFFDPSSATPTVPSKIVVFPFNEAESEIYILGDTATNVPQCVAFWNNKAIKTAKDSAGNLVFPNGLVGDASGNLTDAQKAAITPAATDVKAWNYGSETHTGLMLGMYDQDLSPKLNLNK